MLGRPSFLVTNAIICALGAWALSYAMAGGDDGIIELDANTVAITALLVAIVCLMLILLGVAVRILTKPMKSETFVARQDNEYLVKNEAWFVQSSVQPNSIGTEPPGR